MWGGMRLGPPSGQSARAEHVPTRMRLREGHLEAVGLPRRLHARGEVHRVAEEAEAGEALANDAACGPKKGGEGGGGSAVSSKREAWRGTSLAIDAACGQEPDVPTMGPAWSPSCARTGRPSAVKAATASRQRRATTQSSSAGSTPGAHASGALQEMT